MRILHVVHGLARGGLENGVVNLVNRLPASEFEQAVCCLDLRGEMAQRLRGDNPVSVLGRGRHDLGLPLRLRALIRRWQPDVIHCRNWNTWLDTALARLLAPGRHTLIWSFHGFPDGDRFPGRRRVASHLLAAITDDMFAVCRDSATRYARLTGISPVRFDVLYNGVDCDAFQPATDKLLLRDRLALPRDKRMVLTVASLTPIKDHDLLLTAAARVLGHGKDDVSFVFVGEGGQRSALEARIRELGLSGKVLLPGNSDRVAEYLAAADMFVLPSRLEGMSNAILEAMASGLPVVANRVGGNPELVVEGETGLLCRQGDSTEMANAIERLLADAGLRKQLGRAARKRAVEHFSIDCMMQTYADYYRRRKGLSH